MKTTRFEKHLSNYICDIFINNERMTKVQVIAYSSHQIQRNMHTMEIQFQ